MYSSSYSWNILQIWVMVSVPVLTISSCCHKQPWKLGKLQFEELNHGMAEQLAMVYFSLLVKPWYSFRIMILWVFWFSWMCILRKQSMSLCHLWPCSLRNSFISFFFPSTHWVHYLSRILQISNYFERCSKKPTNWENLKNKLTENTSCKKKLKKPV